MNPIDIDSEQRRRAERDDRILRLLASGKSHKEIAGLMGIELSFVREVILKHHRAQAGRNGGVYAQLVEHQGRIVWAEPAPAQDGDALQTAEIWKAVRAARGTGNRVMICIAVLPPDEEITLTRAAS